MADTTLWDDVLGRIELKVNKHSFYTWFRPTSLINQRGQDLMIRVPNPVFRDWLTKHYSGVIAEALSDLGHGSLTVSFVAEAKPEGADPLPALVTPDELAHVSEVAPAPRRRAL
jgi:chromosomal replication initiator protein